MWYVYHTKSFTIYDKRYLEQDAKKRCRKRNRPYGNSPYAVMEVEEGTPDKQVQLLMMLAAPARSF